MRVTIHQGWKRQLRRMFAEVGAPVRRLVRVRIGSLRLEDMAAGDVRVLTPAEVRRLVGGGAFRGGS
jgi:23S rRNA pseudouridine2605 synthase